MNYPGNAKVVHPPQHKQLRPDFREVISDYREINASNISALKRAARNIAAAYELHGEEVCKAQAIRTAIRKVH